MHCMSWKAKYERKRTFSQFSLCQVALDPIKEAKANLKGCVIEIENRKKKRKEGHSTGVLRSKLF